MILPESSCERKVHAASSSVTQESKKLLDRAICMADKATFAMGCAPFLRTALGGAVCVTPSSRLLYFSYSTGAAPRL